MSQAGYTPISLYYSTTAAATPSAGNLVAGELALNTVDEKLYFKNSAGTVKLLASNATSAPVTTFSAGSTGLTPSSATAGAVTLAGTLAVANGGTGLTSFTANGVVYASSTSALATGSALTFDGNKLAVSGAGLNGSDDRIFTVTNTTANSYGAMTLVGTSRGGYLNFYNGATAQAAIMGQASALSFYVGTDSGGSQAMILNSTGLGIGTSSPATKLDVNGAITAIGGNSPTGGFNLRNVAGTVTPRMTNDGADATVIRTGASGGSIKFNNFANTAENLICTDAGNLGLGVTPSAWATVTALQIKNASVYGYSTSEAGVNQNCYYGSGNWRYIAAVAATAYRQISGAHSWHISSGVPVADGTVSFTQAMTLADSGTLLVGTTSSPNSGEVRQLIANNSGGNAFLQFQNTTTATGCTIGTTGENFIVYTNTNTIGGGGGAYTERARIDSAGTFQIKQTLQGNAVATGAELLMTTSTAASDRLNINFSMTGIANRARAAIGSVALDASGGYNCGLAFYTRNAADATELATTDERMRIDSSGNLLVGITAVIGTGKITTRTSDGWVHVISSTQATTQYFCNFDYNGTGIGSIQGTNTATLFLTTSDYRLKNTVVPMTGALAKVALLKPCTYKWNADGSDGQGFIAHELAEVVPQCVVGLKDAVDADGKPQYQGIDTSFLVATLTAAIQEQQAIINSLKARLDAANL